MKSFLLSLQFLTIITVVPGLTASRRELVASLAFFPLTGLVIGAIVAGFDWAARGVWPAQVCGVLDVVLLALITRGLHLDGVADTFDAIGSRADRERALEIMRDSSSGALGILAMISVLLVKVAASVELSSHAAWQWFILVPSLSRLGINVLGVLSVYARRSGGLGEAFTGRSALVYLPVAGLTAISAAWILCRIPGLVMLGLLALWCVPVALFCRHRFGGITGDILGAHLETAEAAMLLAAAALVR